MKWPLKDNECPIGGKKIQDFKSMKTSGAESAFKSVPGM
jgi:hypothetical protein